jgi:Ca-activated chloride channel family protein
VTLDGPATIDGGRQFPISWTGPNAQGDYVAIMASGAERWTNEPYVYAKDGSPAKLVAPTKPGSYELWYVAKDETILARRPITVTDFVGSLDGPATVPAGTVFKVSWTGPDGPRDYVTILPASADKWTTESYFYTADGSPGTLVAPMKEGAYELRYVTGTSDAQMVRRPITVSPLAITLQAPASVAHDSAFQVTWTGPNGPRDYITIVPAGAPVGAYTSYAYTADGNPVTITAPSTAGNYEVRYASDRVTGIFKSIPIVVK